jgi:hypothetical protein
MGLKKEWFEIPTPSCIMVIGVMLEHRIPYCGVVLTATHSIINSRGQSYAGQVSRIRNPLQVSVV